MNNTVLCEILLLVLLSGPCRRLKTEEADDGGKTWTVIQRRGQFGNSESYFSEKLWADYKTGFGNCSGEFWLGLDNMANITREGNWQLRVDLTDWDGAEYFALYDNFRVGPGPLYKLHLPKEGFNTGLSTLGDSLSYSDGMAFSTRDRDNDKMM